MSCSPEISFFFIKKIETDLQHCKLSFLLFYIVVKQFTMLSICPGLESYDVLHL